MLSPTSIVAIPARNEAERIVSCLRALASQVDQEGRPLPRGTFGVLLLVNNTDDDTAEIARSLGVDLPFDMDVIELDLQGQDANAGGARRYVMAEAARRLLTRGDNGTLFTTDADTRVPPRWIADITKIISDGVDAVVGGLEIDPDEKVLLPPSLKKRGASEGRYEALLCALESRLDPHSWDPWPRHNSEPGASLALSLKSFLAVGGVPRLALGEDRALCNVLREAGFRLRHAPEATVITSGRLVGRAAGGCADTMRQRIADPDTPCDPYQEPIWTAVKRYLKNGRSCRAVAYPSEPGLRPRWLSIHILIAEMLLRLLMSEQQPPQRSVFGSVRAKRLSQIADEEAV